MRYHKIFENGEIPRRSVPVTPTILTNTTFGTPQHGGGLNDAREGARIVTKKNRSLTSLREIVVLRITFFKPNPPFATTGISNPTSTKCMLQVRDSLGEDWGYQNKAIEGGGREHIEMDDVVSSESSCKRFIPRKQVAVKVKNLTLERSIFAMKEKELRPAMGHRTAWFSFLTKKKTKPSHKTSPCPPGLGLGREGGRRISV